ncbi:MAG TPA: tetratricopeptide repeat protein [Ktedonobacterales bacterium]
MTPREASLDSTRRGLQLYAQGQQAAALQAFDRALALDDTICLTWVGKGKALLELQRFPEAQAAFEHALSLDPTNTEALHGRALAHEAPRREQARQVAPDLDGVDGVVPLAIEGLGRVVQLIGHALVALFMHH